MAILTREQTALPVAPEQAVAIQGLDGEARLVLPPLTRYMAMMRDASRDGVRFTLELVSASIVIDDGTPLWTADEWDQYAGQYRAGWEEVSEAVLSAVSNATAKKNSPNSPDLSSPSSSQPSSGEPSES